MGSQISTQFQAGGTTYVLTLASPQPTSGNPFGPEDYAYVELLGSFFARQIELEQLQESLGDAELRARQDGERLETLWQIANNPTLRGEELIFAMLYQAAAAIRPPQRFRGVLGRIEGDEVVVIGVGLDPNDDGPNSGRVAVGRRSPLDQTIIPRVGRTEAWEDLASGNDIPPWLHVLGWRAVISTQFDAGDSHYSLTFASPDPALEPFREADIGYLDVLASSFAKQLEVERLECSLRIEEEQSRHHAERLEELWQVVNDRHLQGEDLMTAMLGRAAAAVRQHQAFRGMLWRVAGTDVVIEALAGDGHGALETQVGTVIPLERTIIGQVIAEGAATRSWDDIRASSYANAFTLVHGTRSLIITTFAAGNTTWGLSFASSEPAAIRLGPRDNAYIDVLASFFANHVQQRWQFERIQYQQSHDVLTGLLNRSQFRSTVRSAARTSTHYAIILVDVDAFREINESYGHMIGDAVFGGSRQRAEAARGGRRDRRAHRRRRVRCVHRQSRIEGIRIEPRAQFCRSVHARLFNRRPRGQGIRHAHRRPRRCARARRRQRHRCHPIARRRGARSR
jgi:GGDEF domain-containing protein